MSNAYTPTEWKDGDIITAEKLNHIEEGIEAAVSGGGSGSGGASVYIYPIVSDESIGKSTLQRSYRNLKIDFESGRIVFAKLPSGNEIRLVSFVGEILGIKTVWITPNNPNTSLITATVSQETDYPSWDDE